MNDVAEDILMHYGVKRRSGRYPWGSGKNPYQRSGDFLARVEDLQSKGMSEKAIAEALDLSTTELRLQTRVAKHERRALEADRAKSLREDGKSLNEIAKIMGYNNDSSIRSLLNENTAVNKTRANTTADILEKELKKKGMLDVGRGAERELGCSEGTLKEAKFILSTRGYELYGIGVPQATNPRQQTTIEVLAPKGTEYKDVYSARDKGEIYSVGDYHTKDGGISWSTTQYPASIDSKRVVIKYGDKGGSDKDGVIEIRRGVKDLDLGNSHYAQVRILVDGTHYLKGMAMYSDDIPKGADILFNTNKPSGTDKMDVLKKIDTKDPNNPFGSYIKANGQSTYFDKGVEKLSAINKLREEGDYATSSKNISSQFLSKQPLSLIKKQLDLTYADKVAEFDEICKLTNPTIKKKVLEDFASDCDSAVVKMKANPFPRQSPMQVILPVPSMKPTEIYAPNYRDGEKVALVRYPHGGTFEIPVLTVNNKNKDAQKNLGKNILDAVGIHPKVASQLSGADFDGDTVIVIPTNHKVKIEAKKPLKELEGFDPKTAYPKVDGMKPMTEKYKQKQMGVVSNLITDMTLRGAPDNEIARAVKHSMVVIDAVKHELNYKQSEKDNGIAELKKRYQSKINEDGSISYGGASTLISRRKQTIDVPERRGSGIINPKTGEREYKTTSRTYISRDGKTTPATTKVNLLNHIPDVKVISSGTPQENAYANYCNKLKALSNKARKEYLKTGRLQKDKTASETYRKEVDRLKSALNLAAKNDPKERRAQVIANSKVKAITDANDGLTKDDIKKIRDRAINEARVKVGASSKDVKIKISDREWEAIQAGAISDNQLTKIIRYCDKDELRKLATPRTSGALSNAKINKIKAMKRSGYTNAEIADAVGCSVSTVVKAYAT